VQPVRTLSPSQLPEFLLGVALVRPVFLWGQPGIGKSSLVEQFAASLGLECVSLLGTQLAPEDLIGVPQIVDGRSRFCPPEMIARDEPYCLFLDELNAASHDVMKAFYSLVLDRRVGSYTMPEGSIIIGAGNRSTDGAIARTMPTALVNRLVHLHLRSSPADWQVWAAGAGVHPYVTSYLAERPDQLTSAPPKVEEPFSTPRSWHMLSDTLHAFRQTLDDDVVATLAHATLTASHAAGFCAYVKTVRMRFGIEAIVKGDASWPTEAADRDVLYFLAEAFRIKLIRELPADKERGPAAGRTFAHRAKAMLFDLASLSLEMAQLVIAPDEDGEPVLPSWFLVEVVRDLPRLVPARA
jgi:MoxR-like ATPase